MLSALGRREEALAQAEEAVRIYGGLAAERPDAFLPDLAMSLSARGRIDLADKPKEAAAFFREGIELLTPLLLRTPEAHASLITQLAQVYLQACQLAKTTPDMRLLAPVVAVLRQLRDSASG